MSGIHLQHSRDKRLRPTCVGQARDRQWTVEKARLRDVPLLLQMVVDAAQDGDLNPQFMDWRYQIGLAKGLFATLLWGRFKDEHTGRQRASLFVVRHEAQLAGFSLIRAWSPPAEPGQPEIRAQELYLVCVEQSLRRHGVGKALVQHAAERAPNGLVVLVLKHGHGMSRILKGVQASPCGRVAMAQTRHVPVQAYALGEPAERERIARALSSGHPAPAGD
jgi:GNAT superfamily N-acetyltransferase